VAAFAALSAAAWLQLVAGPFQAVETGRALGFAVAPAIALVLTRRWLVGLGVLLLSALPAAGYAMDVPVTDMRRGERDFFGPLFDAIGSGFSDFYETRVPLSPAEFPDSAAILFVAIFLTAAVSGLLVAGGRPLTGGAALVLGVGWPATLASTIPGVQALRTGGVILAAILLVLLLSRERQGSGRRTGPAVIFALVLVLAATGASTSAAVAKGAFLDWQRWNYEEEPVRVGVRYVWSSNYSGITFPEEPTIVLRIRAPEDKRYWRATTLDSYTGVAWSEDVNPRAPELTAQLDAPLDDPLLPAGARDESEWVRQDVTVEALSDTHVIGATTPVRVALRQPAPLQLADSGVLLLPRGLEFGQRYTVWSYSPKVDATTLAEIPADYPAELERYFEVVPGLRFPAFGESDRADVVRQIFRDNEQDALLTVHEPLYEQALAVIEEADTPYLAVAALEAWFRGGDFAYEEQPPPYGADPPLVTFVLDHKVGYCQQYAGAMALMLRMLGVPSRVAAGFTSGEYDERLGEWVVEDHNAHTWVEAWFPEHGWIPFDPTPGRGQLGGSYSTSSATFGEGVDPASGLGARTPTALQSLLQLREGGVPGGTGDPGGTPAGGGTSAASGQDGRAGRTAALVLLIIAVVVGLVYGVKEARRRARFRGSDPRRQAGAVRRELLGYLGDQGITFANSSTLGDIGAELERRFRIDTKPFVRAATEARFGPHGQAEVSVRRARRELRELERQIRGQLTASRRLRGAFHYRSLGM
jgi:transglutaminase-like putative cysteine protease